MFLLRREVLISILLDNLQFLGIGNSTNSSFALRVSSACQQIVSIPEIVLFYTCSSIKGYYFTCQIFEDILKSSKISSIIFHNSKINCSSMLRPSCSPGASNISARMHYYRLKVMQTFNFFPKGLHYIIVPFVFFQTVSFHGSEGVDEMGAESNVHIFRNELHGRRPVLGPVCVVTYPLVFPST